MSGGQIRKVTPLAVRPCTPGNKSRADKVPARKDILPACQEAAQPNGKHNLKEKGARTGGQKLVSCSQSQSGTPQPPSGSSECSKWEILGDRHAKTADVSWRARVQEQTLPEQKGLSFGIVSTQAHLRFLTPRALWDFFK